MEQNILITLKPFVEKLYKRTNQVHKPTSICDIVIKDKKLYIYTEVWAIIAELPDEYKDTVLYHNVISDDNSKVERRYESAIVVLPTYQYEMIEFAFDINLLSVLKDYFYSAKFVGVRGNLSKIARFKCKVLNNKKNKELLELMPFGIDFYLMCLYN